MKTMGVGRRDSAAFLVMHQRRSSTTSSFFDLAEAHV
jgi:hypothetical protein